MADWSRAFDEPISLPRGRQLVTLKDAANHIQKLPKAEQLLEEWQAAVEAMLLVVELDGPTMTARIGVQRSHDLSDLLSKALEVGLRLPHGIPEFIENQSLFHQEFWFRYPERAGMADVYLAPTALYAAEMLLRAVFDLTDASTKF
jgi:hypothetical protein